jgi:glucose/arabinose dehydrogenase
LIRPRISAARWARFIGSPTTASRSGTILSSTGLERFPRSGPTVTATRKASRGTGALWESEHGPNSGDEINLIQKGHNYGWGVATKASQPGMVPSAPGMNDPIIYYVPSMATAGIAFYTGDRYPAWKNTSLFVGGLVGQRLERLELADDKVVEQEVIFNQFGRVRDIVQGPDGYFYIALQSQTAVPGIPLGAVTPGQVIRLIPEP